jgi:hypothetical protein
MILDEATASSVAFLVVGDPFGFVFRFYLLSLALQHILIWNSEPKNVELKLK